jgi:hypothetical protein
MQTCAKLRPRNRRPSLPPTWHSVESLEARKLLSAGSLNTAFGHDGSVTVKLNRQIGAIVGQAPAPDGGILVAGDDGEGGGITAGVGFILDITTAGKLDTTFGDDGILRISSSDNSAEQITSMIVQPNGEILVGSLDGSIRAFDGNGGVETSFGTDGVLSGTPGGLLASGPSNTFYLGSSVTSNTGFQLAQYSFTGTVLHTSEISTGVSLATPFYIASSASEVVLFGTITVGGGSLDDAVAAFSTNAQPIDSFGTDGLAIVGFESTNLPVGIGLEGAGTIVLSIDATPASSSAANSGTDFVTELNDQGKFIKTFGTKGRVVVAAVSATESSKLGGNAIAIQGDGRIVVANYFSSGSVDDLLLARLKTTGIFDKLHFGTKGVTKEDVGSETPDLVQFDSAGNIDVAGVVPGSSNNVEIQQFFSA